MEEVEEEDGEDSEAGKNLSPRICFLFSGLGSLFLSRPSLGRCTSVFFYSRSVLQLPAEEEEGKGWSAHSGWRDGAS